MYGYKFHPKKNILTTHKYCSEQESYTEELFFFFLKIIYLFILFLERGEWREKEMERNINVWLPLVYPLLRTWPATQAFALTGNQTSNPLVFRLALDPLSHTSQGRTSFLGSVYKLAQIKCIEPMKAKDILHPI